MPNLMEPSLGKKKKELLECFFSFKVVESEKLANPCTILCDTPRPKKWRKQIRREIRSPRIISFVGGLASMTRIKCSRRQCLCKDLRTGKQRLIVLFFSRSTAPPKCCIVLAAEAGGNMLKEKHQSEKEILWANEKQKEPIPKEGKDLDTEVSEMLDNRQYFIRGHAT